MTAVKRKLLPVVALACVLCLCLALVPTPVEARSAADVQAEIEAKKDQLEQLEAKINDGKSDKAAAQAAIDEYQQEYDSLLGLIDEQDKLINSTEGELDAKGDELAETIVKLQENKEKYEKRLVAIYKTNHQSVLSVLLNVDSFSEFIQMLDALQRISKNDTAMLEELMVEREKYENQQVDLEDTITDLTGKMDELQANRDWAAAKVGEMQVLADSAEAQIAEGEQEKQYTAEDIARLNAEAQEILAETLRLSSSTGDGSVRQTANGPVNPGGEDTNSGGDNGGDSGNSGGNSGGNTPPPSGGILAWPVPTHTYISSYYGDPRANTGWHYGIDFPAPQGTTIVAAAPGRVVKANYHSSYGNHIVIDHGDGLTTLYAHCSQLFVGAGTNVTTNQPIAAVGNTGDSFGAHLHFEVTDGGGRVNPLGYLM